MNINATTLNFGTNRWSDCTNQVNNRNTTRPSAQRSQQIKTPQYDEFRRLKQEEQRKNKLMAAYANRVIGAIAALAIAASAQGIVQLTKPEEYETIPTYGNELSEISQYTGIPEDIFRRVNNVSVGEGLEEELILPQIYTGTQDKIEEYQEKLANEDLSDKKRAQYEEELAEYQIRKEKQDKMGVVYINPQTDKAYIKLNDDYSTEEIKYAWGIKDGVLKKYNDLDYTWTYCDPLGRSVMDYTNNKMSGIVNLPADELNP